MKRSGKESALDGPDRLLGTRILDFELVDVLGAGGMSVVYRARHPVTLQEVAIKILPPELAVHDELKARFVEEARVLAVLEHPNITALNNFVEGSGRLCLIMQFVEGTTFEKRITELGRVPVAEALRVGIEVCKALEYAHARNVIHRDIKPSNVLLRADGAVKVTDFGIAKILGQSRLTSTGQTMGTVRYMSPEQVRGKAVDLRSDLYSLGVTIFEALAGVTPFDGETPFDIMQKHLNTRPAPLAKHGAQVAPFVEKAVLRAMEKDPKARYADATEMRLALEEVLARDPTAAAPAIAARAPRRRSGAALFALSFGVVVAVGGAATVVALQLRKPRAPVEQPQKGAQPKDARAPAAKDAWPEPYLVRGLKPAADEKFAADGLRVQSASARDAQALAALRDRYRAIARGLAEFLKTNASPAARVVAPAAEQPPPLNLVLAPQALLDQADLWPGWQLDPTADYPSRYVPGKRTLYVADAAGFEREELPFAVALHVLASTSLSDADCRDLADQFSRWYPAHATVK